jgi:hypothetical protein
MVIRVPPVVAPFEGATEVSVGDSVVVSEGGVEVLEAEALFFKGLLSSTEHPDPMTVSRAKESNIFL